MYAASTLKSQSSTLNPQPSTLYTQPFTLNTQLEIQTAQLITLEQVSTSQGQAANLLEFDSKMTTARKSPPKLPNP